MGQKTLSSKEHQDRFYKDYLEREASMAAVYEQTLRLTQELLNRVEREMFKGMQYKAMQDGNPDFPAHNKELAKSAEGLGKLVVALQRAHLQLLKEGERQRKNMSLEEKMAYMVRFAKALPKDKRRELYGALGVKDGT